VEEAIETSGNKCIFSRPGKWIEASGAANAHFMGIRNVCLAADSFSIGIKVPDGTQLEVRWSYFRASEGPAIKATIVVDAFGVIRHYRAGDGMATSDSGQFLKMDIGKASTFTKGTKHLPGHYVVIGDLAYGL
jgi:hypothetical protein